MSKTVTNNQIFVISVVTEGEENLEYWEYYEDLKYYEFFSIYFECIFTYIWELSSLFMEENLTLGALDIC